MSMFMFKSKRNFFSQFKFHAEEEEEEEIVETPQAEEEEEEEKEKEEPEEEEEEEDDDEEELVDPKDEIDKHCHSHCIQEWKEYEGCAERIKLLPDAHCHSWYTDYRGCVAHCVSF
jgi:hypothetical protein